MMAGRQAVRSVTFPKKMGIMIRLIKGFTRYEIETYIGNFNQKTSNSSAYYNKYKFPL